MKRGDLITVVVSGDHGKPRPAVVVQTNAIKNAASRLVCLLTSKVEATAPYRLLLEPTESNGLRRSSLVMTEKIHAVNLTKCGPAIGRVTDDELARLDSELAFVLGLAD